MKEKKLFALIIIIAIILRLAYAFIVPIYEKPDEQQHFQYIEFVEENRQIPIQEEGLKGEFYQPSFYYIGSGAILFIIRLFTDNAWIQVLSMRLLSATFSIATLFFIYRISILVFKKKEIALSILMFASFLPSHININSDVTNANFGDLLSTIIIFLILKVILSKDNQKNIIFLGITVGIALITRWSIVPAIMVIPIAFFIKYYPKLRENKRNILVPLLLIASIAIVISGWHLFRNLNLYGDLLGINAIKIHTPPAQVTIDIIYVLRLIGWTFITFWASFGRTNGVFIGNLESSSGIITFAAAYLILLTITLASVWGLVKLFRRYIKSKSVLSSFQRKAFLIFIVHLTITLIAFVSFSIFNFQPQGRLFFPAIAPISILFIYGLFNLFRDKHTQQLFASIFISFIILNLVSLYSIIQYYYL